MNKNQQVIVGVAVTLVVMAALWSAQRLGGELDAAGRLGVDLVVDHRWVALEAHRVSSDRGGTVPDQAWEGEVPPRGAMVKEVRLAALPNIVGRVREGVVVVRAVGRAAFTVMRYLTGHDGAGERAAAGPDTGDRDADRG